MTDFKPGDVVTPVRDNDGGEGTRYTVIAVADGDVVWLKKVEPFFEVGKTYRRSRGEWSIRFQMNGTENFEPVRVEIDSNGRKTAFGKLTIEGWSKYKWVTNSQYDFVANEWELKWDEVA